MTKRWAILLTGGLLSGCAQFDEKNAPLAETNPQMEYGATCHWEGVTSVPEASGGGSCPARQPDLIGTHCTCFTVAGIQSGRIGQ